MNKSVFITGATVNTGLCIAEKFAKEGYDVFIGSRSVEKAEETAGYISEKYGIFAKGYGTISFDEENVKQIFEDIEKMGYLLDCLVLNAANLGVDQDFFTISVEEFMDVINTNVGWSFMLCRAAALQMRKKSGGSIVFVNSNTAYRAIPDRAAYTTSKSGALGLMRALAFDLGRYNIRVNAVLPGMIKTDRWDKNPDFYENVPSRFTPIGDVATGEDMANAVWYFGSDMSRNTTGAELTVDGGNMIQLYPIYKND